MRRFNGQAAIVTGGASGIGLAAAQRLAAEGARIAVWDRDASAIERISATLGAAPHHETLDIADADAVAEAARRTHEALGQVDVLVCSAGVTGPVYSVEDYPVAEWRRVFEVNLHGLFYCNQAIVPFMRARDYGRIVNIASVAGKEGNPNASAYSASKAAVIGFTKSLGKELAATGIRANCVTPAAVRTAIFDQMTAAQIAYMLSKIPMGRFGTVEENAAMICFLASAECSFSTGAAFDTSGGRATY